MRKVLAMARRADCPCAGCGKLLWGGTPRRASAPRVLASLRATEPRLIQPTWPSGASLVVAFGLLAFCPRD